MYSIGRRRSHKKSRRSRKSRKSHKRSVKFFSRVGNKVIITNKRGKSKKLKIKKDKYGQEYYVTGKRKTKHYLEHYKRRFGNKDSLLNIMGNFNPPAQMSLAQSTTGMSAPQMFGHLRNISPSNLSNFYTEVN